MTVRSAAATSPFLPRLAPLALVSAALFALSSAAGCGGRVSDDGSSGTGGATRGNDAGGSAGFAGTYGGTAPGVGGHVSTGPGGGSSVGGSGVAGGAGGSGVAGGVGGSGVGDNGVGVGGSAGGSPTPCVPPGACDCGGGVAGVPSCSEAGVATCTCAGNGLAELQWIRAAMVGSWAGTGVNPWNGKHDVVFTFTADGHYSAHGTQPALYYGSDEDSPDKTYELTDVSVENAASGSIVTWFFPGDVNHDELKQVTVSPDESHLQFEYWHAAVYGPIVYDLHRVK
jgi:hypothetical protein